MNKLELKKIKRYEKLLYLTLVDIHIDHTRTLASRGTVDLGPGQRLGIPAGTNTPSVLHTGMDIEIRE